MLMASIFLLNAMSLLLYRVAHLHSQRPAVDQRYQAQIVITPSFHSSSEYTLTHSHSHTAVYCRDCLFPMCFSNLSSTQSGSQQQCYYCQQDRREPIGAHCERDIHYSWIRNYFHTFGWLWSEEMGVNNHAAYLFPLPLCLWAVHNVMLYRCAPSFNAPFRQKHLSCISSLISDSSVPTSSKELIFSACTVCLSWSSSAFLSPSFSSEMWGQGFKGST